MISKTYVGAQKPRGRQLNAKMCGSETAILFVFFLVKTTMFNSDVSKTVTVLTFNLAQNSDTYYSAELYDYSASL